MTGRSEPGGPGGRPADPTAAGDGRAEPRPLLLLHAVWFAVTAVVAVPLAALLAGRFAPRRSPHDPVWLP